MAECDGRAEFVKPRVNQGFLGGKSAFWLNYEQLLNKILALIRDIWPEIGIEGRGRTLLDGSS